MLSMDPTCRGKQELTLAQVRVAYTQIKAHECWLTTNIIYQQLLSMAGKVKKMFCPKTYAFASRHLVVSRCH